jgi:hypothetical protein
MHKIRKISNIIYQKTLILDTYLIGYKNAGESIIFIIYTDNNISYTGVIDCYEYNNLNKTIDILNKKNIKNLDFICWTHPDEDHSIGIDNLVKLYANEKTKVFLPGHINGEEYEYNLRIKNTFNMFNENIMSRKRKKYTVRDVCDNTRLEYKKFDGGVKGIYEFKILSIAPNSTLLRKNDFKSSFVKNDYSVAVILSLGEFNLLFSGDIENQTISKFEEYYLPEYIDYIKVPHHTSDRSDKILKYLDSENKCEVACSTVFRKTHLPKKTMIETYKNFAREFYCTGKLNCKDKCDYGIINIKFDIIKKDMRTYLEGNSERFYTLDIV